MNLNKNQLLDEWKQRVTETQWQNPVYLRDLAIKQSSTNLPVAYVLMSRAHELKPDGPLINKKLKEFRQKLETKKVIFTNNKSSEVLFREDKGAVTESKSAKNSKKDINIIESARADFTQRLKSPFILLAVIPWLLFCVYQLFFANPRYESQAQLIVQQPDGMATMDASMALLTGLGMPAASTDTELVKAYIYSNDMLGYLDTVLNLREHYQNNEIDYFSRLSNESSSEDFLEFYQNHVAVEIDEKSAVITINAQGFEPLYALKLNQQIVDRAEWYINEIGHQLANEQLTFIQGEHELVESKLRAAQTKLLNFQQRHQLLDPEAEGMAMQQITYGIESQIATKQAELRVLRGVMSDNAPQVIAIENEVRALKQQLSTERQRLSLNENENLSVSQVLARFTDYKVEMELALKAYMSSQVSLEKSRIEAYRQLKYLVVVESPTTPEENTYPKVIYNITLFGVCILLLYGICNIVIATIKELR